MRNIKIGSNFTVFLLFFGVALLEAFQSVNGGKAALWLAIGVVFLLADNLKLRPKNDNKTGDTQHCNS
jgi:hypothetical protein